MHVSIIGGGGHVGLPMGLVLADSGHTVTLIDRDEETLERIRNGGFPYTEPGGDSYLERALQNDRLRTSEDVQSVTDTDAIVIVIGTPIDEHHNPQMEPLLDVIDDVISSLSYGQLITLRSTVYPGTTSIVRDRLHDEGITVGDDVFLSFAPERIAQHRAFDELIDLPQLIGAADDESFRNTKALFDSIIESECLRLTPTEAELGKLFTNMWRYLTFAAANEFYLITDSFASYHDVNVHRILEQTRHKYPRFDPPSPGANVGGPCLTKDGWFLVDNIPYNELVSASFQINEGVPTAIIEKLAEIRPEPAKVTILGMTFKPNSDDTRNSVSFKLKKQLRMRGYENVVQIEPNCDGFDRWDAIDGSDWVILMTPHDEFDDLRRIDSIIDNDRCVYFDLWGFWEITRTVSNNGWFSSERIGTEPEATRGDAE